MKKAQIYKKAVDILFKTKHNSLRYAFSEDWAGITFDGCQMYFVPKKEFLFATDPEKQYMNLDNLLPKDLSDYRPATVECVVQDGKKQYAKLVSDRNICYVNMDYLKFFEEPRYEIRGERNIVLVYEFGILVGIVCPCIIKK